MKAFMVTLCAGLTLLFLFPPRCAYTANFGTGRGNTPLSYEYAGHAPFWRPVECWHATVDEFTVVAASPLHIAAEAPFAVAFALIAAGAVSGSRPRGTPGRTEPRSPGGRTASRS